MIVLVRLIRRYGLWRVALAYSVAAVALVALAWGVAVELAGMDPLYIRLLAVFAILGLPLVMGLAWAIREPPDPGGKGHVVREE